MNIKTRITDYLKNIDIDLIIEKEIDEVISNNNTLEYCYHFIKNNFDVVNIKNTADSKKIINDLINDFIIFYIKEHINVIFEIKIQKELKKEIDIEYTKEEKDEIRKHISYEKIYDCLKDSKKLKEDVLLILNIEKSKFFIN